MSWLAPVVTLAPDAEAIPLAVAKKHLRVDFSDDDELIASLVAAATRHVENITGQLLQEQEVSIRCTDWTDLARVPLAPIGEVVSIRYFAVDGSEQDLAATAFEARLEGLQPEIVPAPGSRWPSRQSGPLITLHLRCGYPDNSQPAEIVAAVLLVLGDLYASRETTSSGSVTSIPSAASVGALLVNQRRFLF